MRNAATAATWQLLDGTKQGVGLMLLCALGAPASELVLLHYLPLVSREVRVQAYILFVRVQAVLVDAGHG